jgi:hypothetical protein
MKNFLIPIALIFMSCNSFSQDKNSNSATSDNAKVLVYFFHGTHRCQGCINAEKGTVNALNALYKTQLDNGTIKFESVNFEENQNKALAEKYEAAWNKLLFVKNDDSGQKVELTEQAFTYGISNPDEMNKLVKATVDKLLK